ncbi:MAG: TolC family protein, partial [Verrucomicrobiae bacterium]|nr:TolC family protein [Verrucomicrobiae bacterium]
MHKLLLVAVVLCFLAGCSLAPEYERPELPVSESYPETGISPESLESPPVVEWHSFFRDPSLIEIIDTALANNRDIRVAGLNADRIRAILRIQETALIPNLDASGDLLRQRTPGDLSFTGQSITRSTYSVGLEVPSYELDFFGKITGLRDQALQEYLASEEAVLNVELSLVSGVARQYFQLLANYEQLEIVDKSLTAAERFYDLTRNAFEAGVGSELDLRTA